MTSPGAPYVAVIFTSVHSGVDEAGYASAAARMEQLAAAQSGFLAIESARGADGFGITVSYWRTEDDARAWKRQGEHLLAQQTGRSVWYERYRVRVATVMREYSYDAGVGDARADDAGADTEILHLALPGDWTAACEAGEYRISTRGRSLDDEGFIHCSYPRQLEGVANRFYADLTELVILHIGPELLDAEVRAEPAASGGDELFPHVYGPIPTSAVLATTWWDRDEDGLWHRPVQF